MQSLDINKWYNDNSLLMINKGENMNLWLEILIIVIAVLGIMTFLSILVKFFEVGIKIIFKVISTIFGVFVTFIIIVLIASYGFDAEWAESITTWFTHLF